MSTYQTARTLRSQCPWIGLADAMRYVTLPTYGDGSFFGSGFSRNDIAFAHAWYAVHYAPAKQGPATLGPGAKFEDEDAEVKRAYGEIVRVRHAFMVGFERLTRKARNRGDIPMWPGTRNIPRGDSSAWLDSQGLLAAVLSMV